MARRKRRKFTPQWTQWRGSGRAMADHVGRANRGNDIDQWRENEPLRPSRR